MAKLKEYTKEQLDKMRTGKLGLLYMNTFTLNHSGKCDLSQLELVTNALFRNQDIPGKVHIRNHIQSQLKATIRSEDYEYAAVYRDMLRHYQEHVMG